MNVRDTAEAILDQIDNLSDREVAERCLRAVGDELASDNATPDINSCIWLAEETIPMQNGQLSIAIIGLVLLRIGAIRRAEATELLELNTNRQIEVLAGIVDQPNPAESALISQHKPELMRWVSTYSRMLGRFDLALKLATEATSHFAAFGRVHEALVSQQFAGAILSNLGFFQAAEELDAETFAGFDESGDGYRAATVQLNRAHNALTTGGRSRALELLAYVEREAARDETGHLDLAIDVLKADLANRDGLRARARDQFESIAERAARLGDLGMERVASQNVAHLTGDSPGELRDSLPWLQRAASLASFEGDLMLVSQLKRVLGVTLGRLSRPVEALAELDSSVSISHMTGDPALIAQAQADRGALLLATHLGTNLDGDQLPSSTRSSAVGSLSAESGAGLDELASNALAQALATYRSIGDTEGLAQVGHNLAQLYASTERYAAACELLTDVWHDLAESGAGSGPIALQLVSMALLSGDPRLPRESIDRLLPVAASSTSPGDVQLLVEMGNLLRDHDQLVLARAVLAVAAQIVDGADRPEELSIRNDLALVHADLGAWEVAVSMLRDNMAAAESLNNRVEIARAASNLGEIMRRTGREDEAVAPLSLAARLYDEVGEQDQAADAYSSLSSAQVNSGQIEDARKSAQLAIHAAESTSLVNAANRSHFALASVDFADGNFSAAANTYLGYLHGIRSLHDFESLAAALEALARLGDWSRYRRELDRFLRAANVGFRDHDTLGSLLTRPARWWLLANAPERAVKSLASALLIAATALSHRLESDAEAAADGPSREHFFHTLLGVAECLTTPDISVATRGRARASLDRYLLKHAASAHEFLMGMLVEAEQVFVELHQPTAGPSSITPGEEQS